MTTHLMEINSPTTEINHQTFLIESEVPFLVDADLPSRFTQTETTHAVIPRLFSSGAAGKFTQASYEKMVVSLLKPSPLSKLLAQLVTLRETPEAERWLGATWPDVRAFADAETFIHRLPLNMIPLPEISLADDGEVNFLWQSDGVHVDLGFYGTGTFSYFARGKDGRRMHSADVPVSAGVPREIVTLFST